MQVKGGNRVRGIAKRKRVLLPKSPTGVMGFDDILYGGLPKNRTILVSGTAGSGKTVFGMEYILHGALEYGEPGVFVSFQENLEELVSDFASLGYDLEEMIAKKLIVILPLNHRRRQISGEYDLEGILQEIFRAIESIDAKRVVIDTIEIPFAGITKYNIIRADLSHLSSRLKERKVTTVITGEKGINGALTRSGLEEFIADCVISLDITIAGQNTMRLLRIVKCRGSGHSMDEYPFVIGNDGISVMTAPVVVEQEVPGEYVFGGARKGENMMDKCAN